MFYFDSTSAGAESFNTAIGFNALRGNVLPAANTGKYNTAIGDGALFGNAAGSENAAIGYNSLSGNIGGNANAALGAFSLSSNTSGLNNAAVGTRALTVNSTGSANTALGYQALQLNQSGSNNTSVGRESGRSALGSGNVFIGNKAGFNETGSNKFYLANEVNQALLYGDINSGQVLIGNSNPTGYVFKGSRKLNVLGGILSDSVRVALSNTWADYVFDENYSLTTLQDLEQFIKTNKHLPNMPSAGEVATNGIELGDMNIRLVEKIEELTLYILDLERRLKVQEDQQKLLGNLVKRLEILEKK
jgi:hypothetical protein